MTAKFMLAGICAIAFAASCSGASPTPASVQLHFQFATDAGTETYWCQYAQMPSIGDLPITVTGWKWSTSAFHHWALFRTTGLTSADVNGKPFECFGSPETKAAAPASIISQPTTNDTELEYPTGYAVPFASGEVVMLQAHTVNPTGKAIAPDIDITAILAEPDAQIAPLGEFQFYDPFIFVPANGVGHASMRCKVPTDIDIVWAATHQHTRGTRMEAFLDLPGAPPSVSPFLSAKSWEEPATKLGVTHVAAGSSFRVYCDYADHSDTDTIQGPDKATNEMCQLYGFYSPPQPQPAGLYFEACVPEGLAPAGTGDMYGTGAATCGDTLSCISACPATDVPTIGDGKFTVGACWQKCMVNSCPSASAPVDAVLGCLSSKCPAECAAGAADPACQSCIGAKCSSEVGACQSAVCSAP